MISDSEETVPIEDEQTIQVGRLQIPNTTFNMNAGRVMKSWSVSFYQDVFKEDMEFTIQGITDEFDRSALNRIRSRARNYNLATSPTEPLIPIPNDFNEYPDPPISTVYQLMMSNTKTINKYLEFYGLDFLVGCRTPCRTLMYILGCNIYRLITVPIVKALYRNASISTRDTRLRLVLNIDGRFPTIFPDNINSVEGFCNKYLRELLKYYYHENYFSERTKLLKSVYRCLGIGVQMPFLKPKRQVIYE